LTIISWEEKYNNLKLFTIDDESKGVIKDEHSMFRERVNGVVSNTDDWYDLFDVKAGDKLYFAPDKRIRIWYSYATAST
jgi:predicted metalloendopeptidase